MDVGGGWVGSGVGAVGRCGGGGKLRLSLGVSEISLYNRRRIFIRAHPPI